MNQTIRVFRHTQVQVPNQVLILVIIIIGMLKLQYHDSTPRQLECSMLDAQLKENKELMNYAKKQMPGGNDWMIE